MKIVYFSVSFFRSHKIRSACMRLFSFSTVSVTVSFVSTFSSSIKHEIKSALKWNQSAELKIRKRWNQMITSNHINRGARRMWNSNNFTQYLSYSERLFSSLDFHFLREYEAGISTLVGNNKTVFSAKANGFVYFRFIISLRFVLFPWSDNRISRILISYWLLNSQWESNNLSLPRFIFPNALLMEQLFVLDKWNGIILAHFGTTSNCEAHDWHKLSQVSTHISLNNALINSYLYFECIERAFFVRRWNAVCERIIYHSSLIDVKVFTYLHKADTGIARHQCMY